ncbi:MAG: ABC transporter permease [Acidimicrobiia bacterium]|nr:ABC transporter permease [Acidimicrobiia bacterium]
MLANGPSLNSVFSKAVVERSRPAAVAIVLVAFYGGIAIFAYNGFGDTMTELFDAMPEGLRAVYGSSDGTPVGMAVGAVYAIIAPAVLLVFAIGGGTGAAVGEEMKGTLDLLLANPLSRTGVALWKWLVIVIGTVLIALATWLSIGGAVLILGKESGGRNLGALTVMLIGFGLMMGAFAMALAAWTGRSTIGIGVASAIAVASWLITTVLAVNPAFETISKFTPWYLYDGTDPIVNGISWWALGLSLGLAVLFTFLTPLGLSRRDLKG